MKYVEQKIDTLISSNVTAIYNEFDIATTYNFGDEVRYQSYVWKCVPDTLVGEYPSEESPYWIQSGVSNRFAMIDLRSTTKTVQTAGDIIVEFSRYYTMDTLIIGYYSAESITIEHLNDLDEVLRTETITQDASEDVIDYYTYIYSDYTIETDRSAVFDIYPVGTKIKVTFSSSVNIPDTSCGFMLCGEAVDMGKTMEDVKFSFNSYSTKDVDSFGIISINKRSIQELVDFNTYFERTAMPTKRRKMKEIHDDIIAFIVDDGESSEQEGIVTLGTVQDVSPVLTNSEMAVVAWSIQEVI